MKVLSTLLYAFLALLLCLNTNAQDIIYTISGEINSQKTPLDSIALENLSKQTHLGFGNLPARDDYRINLTRDEYWGSTSARNLQNENGLQLVKNLPGTMAVVYRGQNKVSANISLRNANGQRLALKENQVLENGSLVEVEIGYAGIYFLTISTPIETRSFKATGLVAVGNMSIATQSGSPVQLKSEQVYTLAGTGTEKGDNVRVSVFKGGYIAIPVELTVDDSKTLVFPLEEANSNWTRDNQTEIVDIFNPLTGQVWMDRNLGASRVAISSTDEQAYGDLFQWGRDADGHQKINSPTTSVVSRIDNPEDDSFILSTNYPFDWRSPQKNNLWQGVNGVNNPCPEGYRLPTKAEWHAEQQSWSSKNSKGAFESPIKLTKAGYRFNIDGSLLNKGSDGFYWSSSIEITSSSGLNFNNNGSGTNSIVRGYSCAVRCIRNSGMEVLLPTVSTLEITGITTTTAIVGGNISSNGGAEITARGFCWNTNSEPTTDNNITIDSTGVGFWVSELAKLQPNTRYYVRAYATNSVGTVFGEQIEFRTLEETSSHWPRDTETTVVDITNPATGKTWMDRNLGASRVATSSNDTEAYGDLYQWGRAADGHQKRNSPTTSTLSTSDTPGNGNFILAPNGPFDWRSPQNDYLWQGISGINNPCPSAYRLPTNAEWITEWLSWGSNNTSGAYSSPLKLPLAGRRYLGSLSNPGASGHYWSSTVETYKANALYFQNDIAYVQSYLRAYGFSVRCIKDEGTQPFTYNLILNANPAGAGTVSGAGTYPASATVNITATANDGYRFVSWKIEEEAYSTSNNFIYSMPTGNVTLTANFEEIEESDWPRDTETAVIDVTNPTTGKTWMDRNLGASRAATISTDELAYGDLYQWGRAADGHQKRNSLTTSILSSCDTPGHRNFIVSPSYTHDWRHPLNNNLWQGVNGINNPCPFGYRLPSLAEWNNEIESSYENGGLKAENSFNSILKLTLAGYRWGSGELTSVGSTGYYSSNDNTDSDGSQRGLWYNNFNSGSFTNTSRASGFSVRCIKD
jgi:uncharacterized protein (TIGR02145 family)